MDSKRLYSLEPLKHGFFLEEYADGKFGLLNSCKERVYRGTREQCMLFHRVYSETPDEWWNRMKEQHGLDDEWLFDSPPIGGFHDD